MYLSQTNQVDSWFLCSDQALDGGVYASQYGAIEHFLDTYRPNTPSEYEFAAACIVNARVLARPYMCNVHSLFVYNAICVWLCLYMLKYIILHLCNCVCIEFYFLCFSACAFCLEYYGNISIFGKHFHMIISLENNCLRVLHTSSWQFLFFVFYFSALFCFSVLYLSFVDVHLPNRYTHIQGTIHSWHRQHND